MIDKRLKYFCQKCTKVKSTLVAIITQEDGTKSEIEIIKSFSQTITKNGVEEKKEFKARKLECNHFISFYTPAFINKDVETIDEHETAIIRRKIEKSMIGLTSKELEAKILFHCEVYQTLLKIASKQKNQAKYAIQFLDQLREKYTSLLNDPNEKKTFEEKFATFLDLKPQTNKAAERMQNEVDRAATKQKVTREDTIEAVKKLLMKGGYKAKELFKEEKGEKNV